MSSMVATVGLQCSKTIHLTFGSDEAVSFDTNIRHHGLSRYFTGILSSEQCALMYIE